MPGQLRGKALRDACRGDPASDSIRAGAQPEHKAMAQDDKEQERGRGTDSGDDDRGGFVDSDDFGLDAGSDDAVTDRDDDVLLACMHICHRYAVRACPEVYFPKLFAGSFVECLELRAADVRRGTGRALVGLGHEQQ